MSVCIFDISVCCDPGWRQASSRTEVGWQRNKLCQRNKGWQNGNGKYKNH